MEVRTLFVASAVLLLSGCTLFTTGRTLRFIKYEVRSGDTVYGLSQRFQVGSDEIIEFNDLSNPNVLTVGQILKIPYQGSTQRGATLVSGSAAPAEISADAGSVRKVSLTDARKYVGNMVWPVRAGALGSPFGRRWFSFHEGLDIVAAEGVPVYAAHDGVVSYSGNGIRGYGNLIVLKGDKLITVYGHNQTNRVERGERVKRGERIAELGQTGKATGPHLHFETRIQNTDHKYVAVDPLVFYR